ncbi:hypothetical protein FISHEDRAFT_35610 [Fistulina hepatica ATCC 64428]|uniref:DUF952-domain-containing protein n=1 Tax=Fistulina hepatica ATCC 64428 TaxID=1128425 RepID=A0A0D7AM34_9AGAR|nr:hypothetical protein FISHEDRAFT_35610 [Fistulina hepatica ATCC 64428]
MAKTLEPNYIYKLVPHTSPPPEPPLPECLPLSELDRTSGFIHLSTASQVRGTLERFFTDDPCVYVLKIPYGAVKADIRWENPERSVCGDRPGEGTFPHLYNGGKLGSAHVESVAKWENKGGWDQALENAQAWLTF